jgi:hypothetical protein
LYLKLVKELTHGSNCSPFKFFSAKDRSHLDNEEPLPGAVHEYLSVGNGVRWVNT